MPSLFTYIFALCISAIISALATKAVIKYARHHDIVDRPEDAPDRKIHQGSIALLGGTAIFVTVALVSLGLAFFGHDIISPDITWRKLIAVLIGGLILMIGGYLDDKKHLQPLQQIVWPALAVLVVVLGGIRIDFIQNPFGGYIDFIHLNWWGLPVVASVVGFFWILGVTYTTKLLDGLDGLVAGVAAIGSIVICALSLLLETPQPQTALLAIIFAGANIGFLVYNFYPAKIFQGEGGSTFAGFMLAVLAIISGAKIATTLLVLGIGVIDAAWVIIRRVSHGRSPWQADREHLHFKLFDMGLTQSQAVLVLYSISLAFGLAALFVQSFGKLVALIALAVFVVILSGLVVSLSRSSRSR